MNRAPAVISLKLITALASLVTICIALSRAQPFDDGTLRAVVAPSEGCLAPCFMGIRPGVTTGDETLELLRASDWVRYIRHINLESDILTYTGSIRWEWSGKQPAWIDTRHDSWIWINENRVNSINIRTRYRLGEIWLAYGAPDEGWVLTDLDARFPTLHYEGAYSRYHILVTAVGVCPIRSFWSKETLITFRDDALQHLQDEPSRAERLPQATTTQCFQRVD